MTIAITLQLNGEDSFIEEIDAGSSVADLLCFLGLPSDAAVTVNNVEVTLDDAVGHADFVQIEYNEESEAYEDQAPQAAGQVVGTPAGIVLFINNDGGGFADQVPFSAGATLGDFIANQGVCPEGKLVRVNNGIAPVDYLLHNGDKISVTPLKVEGAVETIKVLYINNDGAGFASSVEAIAGVTLQQFLAQKAGSVEGKLVRLNNEIASGTTPLKSGDKISVTPLKVEGA